MCMLRILKTMYAVDIERVFVTCSEHNAMYAEDLERVFVTCSEHNAMYAEDLECACAVNSEYVYAVNFENDVCCGSFVSVCWA
jgi:hypothetical protein